MTPNSLPRRGASRHVPEEPIRHNLPGHIAAFATSPIGPEEEEWSAPRKIAFRFLSLFVLLFIAALPFPRRFLPDTGSLLAPVFEPLARLVGRIILGPDARFTAALISDSTGLYLHTLNLAVIALILCVAWSVADRRRKNYARAAEWFVAAAGWYLALQLFVYGFDKVFKTQFYLPEPNTLFTTVGETPRDLLYWSVMGASRPYTMFTGAAEVLAAALLLFRTTRTLGALVAFGVLLNVAAINLSYDISVKLYSSFLLFLSVLILAPQRKRMAGFFSGKAVQASPSPGSAPKTGREYLLRAGGKGAVVVLILFESLSRHVAAGNFNDDAAPRPPLHGAYQVTAFAGEAKRERGEENGKEEEAHSASWKRIFVHRRGYLIIQTADDRMHDYELRPDTARKTMTLIDPADGRRSRLRYSLHREPDSTIVLEVRGALNGDSVAATARLLDLNALPLLRGEFHWTVDVEP